MHSPGPLPCPGPAPQLLTYLLCDQVLKEAPPPRIPDLQEQRSVRRVAESVTQWAEAAAGLCFPEMGAKAGSPGSGAGQALASQSTAAAARVPPLGGGREARGGRGRGAKHFGGSCMAFGQPSLESSPTEPQQWPSRILQSQSAWAPQRGRGLPP